MKRALTIIAVAVVAGLGASAFANHGTLGHWKRDLEYTACDLHGSPPSGSLAPRAEVVVWDSTSYHWREMYVLRDALDYYDDRIEGLCISIVLKANDAQTRQTCPYETGKVRVCNGTWSGVDHAVFDVLSLGSHMDVWDMRIRYDDGNDFNDGGTEPNEIDSTYENRRYFVCHELGHAIGLDHNDDEIESCLNNFSDSQYPTDHDLDTLRARYSHVH